MKLSSQDKKALQQAEAIRDLTLMPGWADHLKPWLEVKLNQSFPDPSQFKDEQEFLYAAKVSAVFKKVTAEILMYVEQQVQAHNEIHKKKFTKNKYKIGE